MRQYTSTEISHKLEEVFKKHGIAVEPDAYYRRDGTLSEPGMHTDFDCLLSSVGNAAYRADTLLEICPEEIEITETFDSTRWHDFKRLMEDQVENYILGNVSEDKYSSLIQEIQNTRFCKPDPIAELYIWLDKQNYKFVCIDKNLDTKSEEG